ncbi:[NiFe]-hydrogenase assembly chaperone HybE [Bradyrhizobium xenonodulans]|uniref:[NiFe]-hydrogenase assembly chaperone HybE n=1 Tax=Bradyrhizobium xenonodulans TaxID=2736875 RepID=A0ABY7MH12_9BRAD|nr:[NiFe]-hydrogenase assembly chaperone HybE [Bradyrhizobium xenonodulans]WBL77723.1 [NiFe]-hydrogenase assembly chaperone HybE [Bradyrhizobium xenonodulans]
MKPHAQAPATDADAAAWGQRLAHVYRDIGERAMRELPIYNDGLDVEAVGFRVSNGTIIGIMVTPWFMNVVMPAGELAPAASASTLRSRFPAGDIDFILSDLNHVGRIASCSLFSPMFGFADVASARATAEAVINELMLPADGKEVTRRRETATSAIDRRSFMRAVLTEQHE